jgi:hypothetical protein
MRRVEQLAERGVPAQERIDPEIIVRVIAVVRGRRKMGSGTGR